MWQWSPTGLIFLHASASRYAAGISLCGMPNLLVASPVAIFGCVGTSSAGFTRNAIFATFPAAFCCCIELVEFIERVHGDFHAFFHSEFQVRRSL